MDTTALVAGVSFLPAMIGMFGIGEILNQIFEFSKKKEAEANAQIELVKKGGNLGRVLPTWAQVKQFFRPTLIAGTESTIIGAIPAAGGDIASIICWGQAKRMSKHPEEYGNGSPEGFAVSCTANNGVLGGALTTMLTLGIPGDAVTAILIGSLMMYGMQPGPKMFTEHADFVMQIMQLMLRRYPAIARGMARRHLVYNRQLDQILERELAGKCFVIRPPEDLKIGRTEKDAAELERVYQTGRITATKQLDRIREFLEDGV